MADSLGPLPLVGAPLVPGIGAAGPATFDLAQQPPAALLLAATLVATVVGRGGNGALLLATQYGTIALKTALPLSPGARVDLRILPGPPPTVALLHVEEPPAPPGPPVPGAPPGTAGAGGPLAKPTAGGPAAIVAETPSAQLDLGTELEAVVTAPAPEQGPELPAGTRLLLRLALPAPGDAAPSALPEAARNTFSGIVAPGSTDKTLVATPLGTLALDRLLSLPAGTPLSFTRLATLPPAAAPETADLGTTIEARLLSPPPGDDPAALAPGTRLLLKVAPLPLASPDPGIDAALLGKVVASTSTETVVETDLGTLALERRLSLPAGTLLGLQRLMATPPDARDDVPVGPRWPALDQALSVLDRAAPDLAARLRSDLAPASGQRLAGTLLFLMGAVTNGTWPGAKTAAALDLAGRHDLALRLDGDAAELRRLADPPSGDWRVLVLPLLDGAMVQPVRLYLRRRSRSQDQADQGTRFVLDVDMSRLGALQLDGLVRQQRFDLVLRSHRAIPQEMRQDISALFHDATSAAGLAGDIVFTTASRFAVAPLEALRAHIGVQA